MDAFSRRPLHRHRLTPRRRRSRFHALCLALGLAGGASAAGLNPAGRPPADEGWGWLPQPPGRLVPVGDLPLGMASSPNGQWLAISHGGASQQALWLFDVTTTNAFPAVVAGPDEGFFRGVAFSPDGRRLYASGGGTRAVSIYDLSNWWRPLRISRLVLGHPRQPHFAAGLALTPDGRTLCVADLVADELAIVDVADAAAPAPVTTVSVGPRPFTVAVDKHGLCAYVALWGEPRIAVVDLKSKQVVAALKVGARPSALAFSPDGALLYAACADADVISVIDTGQRKVVATLDLDTSSTDLQPCRPQALAVAPDGKRLYVASAMNHDVIVVDTTTRKIAGMIPAGWCPTAVALSPDGGRLHVLSARDLSRGPHETSAGARWGRGLLQILPVPDDAALRAQSEQVAAANLLDERSGRRPIQAIRPLPVPRRVGHPSTIRYVVMILQDRHSFDRVFGDIPTAAADPWFCLFGREITGNLHSLAASYTLCDNFYLDGPLHAGDRPWLYGGTSAAGPGTGSWSAEAGEKTGAAKKSYSSSSKPKPVLPADGSDPLRWPTVGTLWELAGRANMSRRAYGDFAGGVVFSGTAHTNWISGIKAGADLLRSDLFARDALKIARLGSFPRLSVVALPNNQTVGTAAGGGSPRAMACENDLAIGRIINTLSQTKYWNQMLVLVLPDQPAVDFDHLDAHRAPLLVVSPYARRGAIISRFYDGPAVIRTVEQILGLAPAGLYDMAAAPMWDVFTPDPNPRAFRVIPVTYDIGEKNPARAFGQADSAGLSYGNLKPDRAAQLARILWIYLHGPAAPPPVLTDKRRTVAPPEMP